MTSGRVCPILPPMTMISRAIYRYPTGVDVDLEHYAHPLERQTGGPHISPRVSVGGWARERDLPMTFVDNCWLRVTVTRDQILDFLRTNTDPIQRPPPDGWEAGFTCDRYVLEEEEF